MLLLTIAGREFYTRMHIVRGGGGERQVFVFSGSCSHKNSELWINVPEPQE